jgi:hypothetical protein
LKEANKYKYDNSTKYSAVPNYVPPVDLSGAVQCLHLWAGERKKRANNINQPINQSNKQTNKQRGRERKKER